MENSEQQILRRWRDLKTGGGLVKARRMSLLLRIISLCSAVFIVFAVTQNYHPALLAIAGTVFGYCVAEGNALSSRIAMWPLIEKYLDWDSVNSRTGEASNVTG